MNLSKFGVDVKDNKPKEVDDSKLNINVGTIQENFKTEEIEKYLPWFLKYQINNFDDLPKTKQVEKIINFIENFKFGKSLLLGGAPGCGKTTTVLLLSQHYNYELFELNASDSRNKKSIDESLRGVVNQQSLFGKKKLILIDEVDGIAGREDRGGVSELVKFVKGSKYPIIATANDISSNKVKPLKKASIVIDFEEHTKELFLTIGSKILLSEKIKFDKKALEEFIDKRNSSDIRGFINDLQASVIDSVFCPQEELEIRNYKQKINSILDSIYYSYPEDALRNNFNTDVNLDDLFLFLEENTPKIYDKSSLILAFNEISKADVFKGRIIRWQYWRYLVYINFYLTYGVSSTKNKLKKDKYSQNSRILKKWIYGNKMNVFRARTKIEKKKKEEDKFIEKLAKEYHISTKRARSQELYYFAKIYQNNSEFRKTMNNKFQIDEEFSKKILLL